MFFVKVLCLRAASSRAAFPRGILGDPKQVWPPRGAFQVGQRGGLAPAAGEEGEGWARKTLPNRFVSLGFPAGINWVLLRGSFSGARRKATFGGGGGRGS